MPGSYTNRRTTQTDSGENLHKKGLRHFVYKGDGNLCSPRDFIIKNAFASMQETEESIHKYITKKRKYLVCSTSDQFK